MCAGGNSKASEQLLCQVFNFPVGVRMIGKKKVRCMQPRNALMLRRDCLCAHVSFFFLIVDVPYTMQSILQ